MRADFVDNALDPILILRSQPEKPEVEAWNWQGAAILDYSRTGTAHASVSSRTRFPTLFERYSTRFGSRAVDPNLDPERSTNYELGASDMFGDVKVSGALLLFGHQGQHPERVLRRQRHELDHRLQRRRRVLRP